MTAGRRERIAEAQARERQEIARLLHVADGSAAARKLLKAKITVRDGFVAIRSAYGMSDVVTIQASSPWRVQCGPLGITVRFGGRRDSEDLDEPTMTISEIRPSSEDCTTISLTLAAQLEAMLKH